MYNKISELHFQISNVSYFVFPFIDWHLSCPHVERNRSAEALCLNMMVIVDLD